MKWRSQSVEEGRARFVLEAQNSYLTHSELCRKFEISRPTGYKWRHRHATEGREGLEDRPRTPKSCPWATAPEVVEAILEVRRKHPDFGAKKIAWYLEEHRPELVLPSLKPRANLRAQQRAFDAFRHKYNTVRPHEALAGRTPASLYVPSTRSLPRTLESITYPEHFEVRRVSKNSGIRWMGDWVNVSHLLAELPIGFEEIDYGLFHVYFGPVWLGRFIEAKRCIVDSRGRDRRRKGGNHKRP